MTFKKLALASAVAMVPAMGFAMEEVDDSLLSGITGQDGITLSLDLNLTQDILIEDDDGVPNTANFGNVVNTNAGAINIQDMSLVGNDVEIRIDAGGDATTNAMLAVTIDLTTGLTINTGDIYASNTNGSFTVAGTSNAILDSMAISLPAGTELAIQLGSEETAFLELTGNINTINIANFALNDASSNASISASAINITGLATSGLTVDVENAGLVVDFTTSSMTSVGVDITDLRFGTAAPIGDIRITGLNLTGTTLTISGH
jgi:hypothetical protein